MYFILLYLPSIHTFQSWIYDLTQQLPCLKIGQLKIFKPDIFSFDYFLLLIEY